MPVYKDEKRGTWYVRYRYKDWAGKQHTTTKRGFATKREAKQYEAEIETRQTAPCSMKLKTLYELFVEDKKKQCRPRTITSRVILAEKYILPRLGEQKLSEITPMTIRAWQNWLLDIRIRGNALSQSTLANINNCLSVILNFGVKYYGGSNPLKIAGGIGRCGRRQEFWDENEFKQFIETVKNTPMKFNKPYYTVFMLLYASGMRLGEMLGLSADDFDFKNNTVSITKAYDTQNRKLGPPKNASSVRTIRLSKKIMALMRAYIDSLTDVPERIFDCVSASALSAAIKKYAAIAGLPPIVVHGLRHSHASFLIHHNIPITTISKRLGHKTPKMTLDVYSHMFAASDTEAADVFDKTF